MRLQQAGTLPGGPATGVAVRADHGQIAITSADRLGLFTPQGQRQTLVSPSGRLLVDAVYSGHDVLTLDVTGTLAQTKGHHTQVLGRSLCGALNREEAPHLAANGRTIAVSCPTTLLVGQPGQWHTVKLPVPAASFHQANRVAISPENTEVAVINGSRILRFALPDLKPLATLTRLPGEDTRMMDNPLTPASASTLAYDPQGRRLAVGWNMTFPKAYNQTVTVYDLKSSTGRSLPTYADWTAHFAFSADGRFLLADGTSTPRLWNLTDWTRLRPPQPVNTGIGVESVAWLGQNILSVSSLGALTLTPAGQQVTSFPMPLPNIHVAAFSDNGRWLAAASESGQLYLSDINAKRLVWHVTTDASSLSRLRFNRAGTLLVSGEFVRFWDVNTGKTVGPTIIGGRTVAGFTTGDQDLVLDGRAVPVGPLLRRRDQIDLATLPGHRYRTSSSDTANLTPDGTSVCETQLVFRDRGLGLRASAWQLAGLDQNAFGLSLPEERQLGATSADCRVLAVAALRVIGKEHTSNPLGIEVYDPATGNKRRVWPSAHRVKSLAVSPDGRRIAWLEEGRAALTLGEVTSGRQTVWPLPAVVQDIHDVPLVFRADGKALLVGIGSLPESSFTVLSLTGNHQ